MSRTISVGTFFFWFTVYIDCLLKLPAPPRAALLVSSNISRGWSLPIQNDQKACPLHHVYLWTLQAHVIWYFLPKFHQISADLTYLAISCYFPFVPKASPSLPLQHQTLPCHKCSRPKVSPVWFVAWGDGVTPRGGQWTCTHHQTSKYERWYITNWLSYI